MKSFNFSAKSTYVNARNDDYRFVSHLWEVKCAMLLLGGCSPIVKNVVLVHEVIKVVLASKVAYSHVQ